MNFHFLDDIIDPGSDSVMDPNHIAININPEINTYNTIPDNLYWYNRILDFVNNNFLYNYDENIITEIQYQSIMDFLEHFH